MNVKLKIINKYIAFFILACNLLYFIPINIKNVFTGFGPMGFGLIAFPFILIINLFTIPAFLTFKEKNNSVELLVVNTIGVFIILFLFIQFKIFLK